MTDTQGQGDCWWREFFGNEDGIPLSFFPSEEDTDAEVAGLMDLLDLQPGMTVADICCGAGRHSLRLAERGLDVVGLDASDFMLAKAVRRTRMTPATSCRATRRPCPLPTRASMSR